MMFYSKKKQCTVVWGDDSYSACVPKRQFQQFFGKLIVNADGE
eukprot:CAMPEP_0172841612 /NCGR_PEP_ID=MMETSP1075-20121228/30113_1 /TAXON_ID=2916 /ORGANISM="Ceratium fusus, Strain PA161109" /LENGTH=42 /DNA_ID= /DNA_START= /DNA_END= /DNA_ORIENTATION=